MAELLTGFDCGVCGQHHSTLPLSFSIKAPLAAMRVPLAEQYERVVLSADQCVIDQRRYFLRGRIVVPVHELPTEPFIWGVWAEVSAPDFFRTQQMWTALGRELEPPFAGWMNTNLPIYPATVNLEVAVQTQVVGRRPHFHVADAAHPLAQEQRNGISLGRVREIAEALLHPGQGRP